MPNKHGDFIWYELLTSDADAAQDFYGSLLGWTFADSGYPDTDYRIFSVDGPPVGGLMAIDDEMKKGGARPAWLGYIAVDDVDASVDAITKAGGSVTMPALDMDGIGRMAMIADPQGAMVYVMKGASDEKSESFAETDPKTGHCAWNELITSDPAAAVAFYGEQFGWEKDSEMDMGPMGTYYMIRHDYMLGGVMQRPDEMPVSAWAYYFRVPDIDKATETVKAKGGEMIMGPQEIPGGEYVINAIDPQGAMFALIGKRG